MKTSRLLALPAIAAAALLTMTGCFQLPGAPTTNPGTTTTPTDGGGGGGSSEQGTELAGTTWSGTDGGNTMTFLLNEDGTIDFTEWNEEGGFNVAQDTWAVSGSDVTITITTNAGDLVYTGAASTGSMSLAGSGTAQGQTLEISQS